LQEVLEDPVAAAGPRPMTEVGRPCCLCSMGTLHTAFAPGDYSQRFRKTVF
jgi:hypothetical protein